MRVLLTFLMLFFLLSFVEQNKIVGYWELYRIEKLKTNRIKEKRTKFIQFNADGKLEGGRIGEKSDRFGFWEMKGDLSSIDITVPDYPSENGTYEILKLTDNQLVLFKDSVKIFLDRGSN